MLSRGSPKRFFRARAGSPAHRRSTQFCVAQGSSAHARVHRCASDEVSRLQRFFRARAGSPTWRGQRRRSRRFFRARAGSPAVVAGPADARSTVLPRTRGFTGVPGCRPVSAGFFRARAGSPSTASASRYADGSSAHARVHRASTADRSSRSGFFRARAGSPRVASAPMGCRGSSAHARVHRVNAWQRSSTLPVLPRTRGFTDGMTADAMARFFRARAGSPSRSHDAKITAGSSAHARVHRADASIRLRAVMVLPRTRGFTDVTSVDIRTAIPVLPRTRGLLTRDISSDGHR